MDVEPRLKSVQTGEYLFTLSPTDICKYDPLARILLKLSRLSIFWIFCITFILYGTLAVLAGWYLSEYYRNFPNVISLFDYRELPVALYVYLVAAPTGWSFYSAEAIWGIKVFQDLLNNNVFKIDSTESVSMDDFFRKEFQRHNNPLVFIVIVALTIIVASIGVQSLSQPPIGALPTGVPLSIWWLENKTYFWFIWVPLVYVNFYVILWIVYRRITTIRIINNLFRKFQLSPQLFHSDQANGLLPIGVYAARIGILLTMGGFWLVVMFSIPLLFQQNIRIDSVFWLYIAIYIFGVPSSLILPAWVTHRYMKANKQKTLSQIGSQLLLALEQINAQQLEDSRNNRTQKETDEFYYSRTYHFAAFLLGPDHEIEARKTDDAPQKISEITHLINGLETKYSLIEKNHVVWPFNVSILRRFGSGTITPLLPIFVSIANSILTRYLSIFLKPGP